MNSENNNQQLNIREITNKKIWAGFLSGVDVEKKTFLQSWQWGEFEKKMGHKVWRLGVCDGEEILAIAQVVLIEAKRGIFLFVPHGPIQSQISNCKFKILEILIKELKEIAGQEKCHFIRVASLFGRNEQGRGVFQKLGFKEAPMHTSPEITWVLDLNKKEEELLSDMRKTTRYLIKQGLKNEELKIIKSVDVEDIEIFNNIYQTTSKRHHFAPFSLDYLKNEFLSFSQDNSAVIFTAKYKGDPVASAVVIYWQGIGFYHQGASIQKYDKIPASYLMQWSAILEAKKRNCKLYNFWGVADIGSDQKLQKHPWSGLTLFKKGFGGFEIKYLKTQDLPLTKRYFLVNVFEKLRKIKRGF